MEDHTPKFFSIFTFSTKHAKNSSKSTGTKSWDEPGINGPKPIRVRFEISNFQQKIADHGPIRPDRSVDVVFVDVLDELNGISSRFANTYIQELARRQWLRVDLVDTAQANQFKFGSVQLDGAQATTLGRTLCADAWTLFDAEQVSQWDTITVSINASGAPDRRFNGAEVKSHCENRINTNRQYIDANYDSLRTWLCETYHENDTNCQMQHDKQLF